MRVNLLVFSVILYRNIVNIVLNMSSSRVSSSNECDSSSHHETSSGPEISHDNQCEIVQWISSNYIWTGRDKDGMVCSEMHRHHH